MASVRSPVVRTPTPINSSPILTKRGSSASVTTFAPHTFLDDDITSSATARYRAFNKDKLVKVFACCQHYLLAAVCGIVWRACVLQTRLGFPPAPDRV